MGEIGAMNISRFGTLCNPGLDGLVRADQDRDEDCLNNAEKDAEPS